MTNTNDHNPTGIDERLDALMVAAATEGLAPQDAAELAAALAKDATLAAEAEAYELAATAIDLALVKVAIDESLPQSLREKLLADASNQTASSEPVTPASPGLKLSGTAAQPSSAQAQGFSWTDGRAFGWYAAIAATIALCVLLLQPNQPATNDPTPLANQYAALAQDPDTVSGAWGFAGTDADERYANATGEVIYNTETQTGYMKLNGMPINNPTELQYQLWIVDGTRSNNETTDRIDGGVFNVTAQGEVIIPIDAKIVARQPAVFAITVEKPGGVVVSKGPLQVVAVVEDDAS